MYRAEIYDTEKSSRVCRDDATTIDEVIDAAIELSRDYKLIDNPNVLVVGEDTATAEIISEKLKDSGMIDLRKVDTNTRIIITIRDVRYRLKLVEANPAKDLVWVSDIGFESIDNLIAYEVPSILEDLKFMIAPSLVESGLTPEKYLEAKLRKVFERNNFENVLCSKIESKTVYYIAYIDEEVS